MKLKKNKLKDMRELQSKIIEEMGVKPEIDPAEEVAKRIQFLQDYVRATRQKGFVLGISGGVDSTVAGRLAQLAVEGLGPDYQFFAVRLPAGTQHDESDARAALDFVAATTPVTVNIQQAVDGMESAYETGTGVQISDFNKGNVKARLRMIAQYAIAGDHGCLVVGTDHGAESVTGFFTKYGDGGADILPLFGLNKRQIRQCGEYLGAPPQLLAKVPTADLLDGQPGRADEDELGMTYNDIDDYLEGREIPGDVADKLERTYLRTRHKRTVPVTILDDWWRG